jgi:cation diffusion facilitator CzcD-associated flavoprotein CzcO
MTEAETPEPIFEADVIVVGVGAAGVGVCIALRDAGIADVLVVDRHGVGASFERWPRETRFLTPSFATNAIGMLDINSVAIDTSPAYTLQTEHPPGKDYALYLKSVARHFELPVRDGTDVTNVTRDADGFVLHTDKGQARARFVVWAGGEFQYPRTDSFPGAELCQHTATLSSFSSLTGEDALIIGGYESGMDAAIHLAHMGKKATVLDRDDTSAPEAGSSDPSVSLSTYTLERLRNPSISARLERVGGIDVIGVRHQDGEYKVHSREGREFRSRTPPILATGFRGSVSLVADLFEKRDDGYPLLTDQDESTITPGLFLCGPSVRHKQHVFCFIYKFRQRFGVVATTIAERLGVPPDELNAFVDTYRQWGMYLDDLSCCGEECVC